MEAEPEFESLFPRLQPCEVSIRTTDGATFTDRMDYPMGDPRNPMTPKQMEDKFDALAEGVLSPPMLDRAKAAIADTENAPTITELMECFAADA